MSRYVFDIETDNLLDKLTCMWLICFRDIETDERFYCTQEDMRWKKVLQEAELVVGHNIINFDLKALKKIYGFTLSPDTRIHDTLIMSQVQDYKRFGEKGHGLKVWGEYLDYPKIEFDDYSAYTPEMLTYGQQDVDLNTEVYRVLLTEFEALAERNESIIPYMRAEHAVGQWCADAAEYGWPFDKEGAIELLTTLKALLDSTTETLEAKLGIKTVATDMVKGVCEVKKPKWKKDGDYNHHTCAWFGIEPEEGQEDGTREINGEYCRVEFKKLKLSSPADVKVFLYRNGWIPDQWNTKVNPVTFEKTRTSPKITDSSLEFLGSDGKLYIEYLTVQSRYGITKTWVENVGEDGCLRGDCFPIGTPSMRARHKIIVNVPSADSDYGPEMRRLFRSKPGWKLVGCDSSGNQARGLAHYLNNDEFTRILLHDDIHTYNAQKLTEVLREMGMDHVVERSVAKRILYAFLFGASGGKLWGYIFGQPNEKRGATLKKGFTKAVPGFKDLLDKLDRVFNQTKRENKGYGFIPSIAGTRIYVDSKHKLLVYLLQSLEKITCAGACLLLTQWLKEENIPYSPCIFMHDELQFIVPEEHAERAAELGVKAFQEGPKLFGVTIMNGDSKIGKDWYDTH